MGRYKISLKNGKTIGADDVRLENGFVVYIPRYVWKECPIKAIPAEDVSGVEKIALGWEGGKRFNGKHDSSFSRTPGSL